MDTEMTQYIGNKIVAGIAALVLLASCGGGGEESAVSLRDEFRPRQQTTDYTCGCASALAVMDYFGVGDETESALAAKMHTHVDSRRTDAAPGSAVCLTDYGTSVEELHRYFAGRADFSIVASSFRPADSLPLLADTDRVGVQAVGNVAPQLADYGDAARFFCSHLQAGRPVLVCWNLWGGHWTVCVGYSDRGTPDLYDDDILTMADPYDSTDGRADGFTEVSLVAFFYDWFCTMTPKPWQLQPYLVVAPRANAISNNSKQD